MSVYTFGSTNFLGASTSVNPAGVVGDAPITHHAKDIPKNYAVANWVLTRALQDDIELPREALFRFNLGRTAPFQLTVNSRSQCTLHGNPSAGIPPNQFYCPGCGPDPYTPLRYKPLA